MKHLLLLFLLLISLTISAQEPTKANPRTILQTEGSGKILLSEEVNGKTRYNHHRLDSLIAIISTDSSAVTLIPNSPNYVAPPGYNAFTFRRPNGSTFRIEIPPTSYSMTAVESGGTPFIRLSGPQTSFVEIEGEGDIEADLVNSQKIIIRYTGTDDDSNDRLTNPRITGNNLVFDVINIITNSTTGTETVDISTLKKDGVVSSIATSGTGNQRTIALARTEGLVNVTGVIDIQDEDSDYTNELQNDEEIPTGNFTGRLSGLTNQEDVNNKLDTMTIAASGGGSGLWTDDGDGTYSIDGRIDVEADANGIGINSTGDLRMSYLLGKVETGSVIDGGVFFGSMGIPVPQSGSQDYGAYIAHNAYKTIDGNWKHKRMSTIGAARITIGGGGGNSGLTGFNFETATNQGTGNIQWNNVARIDISGRLYLPFYGNSGYPYFSTGGLLQKKSTIPASDITGLPAVVSNTYIPLSNGGNYFDSALRQVGASFILNDKNMYLSNNRGIGFEDAVNVSRILMRLDSNDEFQIGNSNYPTLFYGSQYEFDGIGGKYATINSGLLGATNTIPSSDISGLAPVATTGSFTDLTNTPTASGGVGLVGSDFRLATGSLTTGVDLTVAGNFYKIKGSGTNQTLYGDDRMIASYSSNSNPSDISTVSVREGETTITGSGSDPNVGGFIKVSKDGFETNMPTIINENISEGSFGNYGFQGGDKDQFTITDNAGYNTKTIKVSVPSTGSTWDGLLIGTAGAQNVEGKTISIYNNSTASTATLTLTGNSTNPNTDAIAKFAKTYVIPNKEIWTFIHDGTVWVRTN